MGAVMGSKNLKGVAVRGSKSVKIADPDRYEQIIKKYFFEIIPNRPNHNTQKSLGTVNLIKPFNKSFNLPIRNGQIVHRPDEEINEFFGETFLPKYLIRHFACFSCRVPCQKQVQIHDGPYAGERGRRPEYGCLVSLCTHLDALDFGFSVKLVIPLTSMASMRRSLARRWRWHLNVTSAVS